MQNPRMKLTTAMLQNLHNLVLSFGSSPIKSITPHLYISVLPFWDNKFNFKPQIQMGIIIEQRHKFIQNEPIAVFEGVDKTSCLALSPDGTQIVIGTDGGKCLILDATTGAQLATSEPHSDYDYDRICSVAFCPDGSRIVS